MQNYLVAGTGNKCEIMVGYFTKHGDGGVDMLPLGDLLKREVKELAKRLGIPDNIIKKPPSAGLWPGQTDEKALGIKYSELDKMLSGDKGVSSKKLKRVKAMISCTQHKRESIKIFKMKPNPPKAD